MTTGCGSSENEQYGKLPETSRSTPTPPATSASPTVDPRPRPTPSRTIDQQIIAQYKRFWLETLPAAFSAPAQERRAILAPVVMDPELELVLHNMAANDLLHRGGYGVDTPLRQALQRTSTIALVRGCLDSSRGGIKDLRTGKKLKRGPAQNRVLVNLKPGTDNVWRISAIHYPGGSGC